MLVVLLGVTAAAALAASVASESPSPRVGFLLFFLAGTVPSVLGLPSGSFPIVIILFVVRDLRRLAPGRNSLVRLVGSLGVVLTLQPTSYGANVATGVVLYWYLCRTSAFVNEKSIGWWLLAGGLAATVANAQSAGQHYLTYVDGRLTEVSRFVRPGLDPNATAALLLLAAAGAATVLVTVRGPVSRLVAGVALIVVGWGVFATGSRTGLVLAMGVVTAIATQDVGRAMGASRRRKGRRWGRAVVLTFGLASLAFETLTSTGLLERIGRLGNDLATRRRILAEALSEWASDPVAVLVGVHSDTPRTSAFAPHNSVAELIVSFGLVGTALLVALLAGMRPTSRPSSSLRPAGWGALLSSLTIGASAQALPWLGLWLVRGSVATRTAAMRARLARVVV